jgi:argininosuccinate lyase
MLGTAVQQLHTTVMLGYVYVQKSQPEFVGWWCIALLPSSGALWE